MNGRACWQVLLAVGAVLSGPGGRARAVDQTPTGFYYPTGSRNVASADFLAGTVGHKAYISGFYHLGQDMPESLGDPLYAIADGDVIESGSPSGYESDAFVVKHQTADGVTFYALYGHVRNKPAKWTRVMAGTKIAEIGSYSSGTHLHFGIHTDPNDSNPWHGRDTLPHAPPVNPDEVNTFGRTDPVSFIETKYPAGSQPQKGSLRVYAEEWSNGSLVRKFRADFQVSRVGGGVVQGWTKTTTDGYLIQNLDPGDYRVEWGTYKDDGGGSVPIDLWWSVPGSQTVTVEANNTRDVWGHYERAEWWPEISSRSESQPLASGQEAVLEVVYRNHGWQTWRNYGSNQTNLGTWDPQDRNSAFVTDDWLGGNRPGPADQSDIGAEGEGRFAFRIRAPQVSAPTDYREAFALVVENVRWLNDIGDAWKVEWSIHVEPPAKGTLSVTTTTNSPVPISGEVFVNGQSWGMAPQSRQVDVGSHTMTFGAQSGWNTPPAQSATVTSNNTTNVVGAYTDTTPPVISSHTASPPSPSNAGVVRIEVSASDAAAGLDRVEV